MLILLNKFYFTIYNLLIFIFISIVTKCSYLSLRGNETKGKEKVMGH